MPTLSWDKTKPVEDGLYISGDLRANFAAMEYFQPRNCLLDPLTLIWAGGDSTFPTHYNASGGGSPTYTRISATHLKVGPYSLSITPGTGAANVNQNILDVGDFDTDLRGEYFSAGAWVKSSSASDARIRIWDGLGGSEGYSSYHTGGGAFEWLSVTRRLDGSTADRVVYAMETTAAIGYFSGSTVIAGPIAPQQFIPGMQVIGSAHFPLFGDLDDHSTTANGFYYPGRPGRVEFTQLVTETGPTGQALIVDVNTWDGSAWTTMYSTKPQIAAAAIAGGAAPDGTYARRCLRELSGATLSAGTGMRIDLDQVGSSESGEDLTIDVRILQFQRPWEALNAAAGGYDSVR